MSNELKDKIASEGKGFNVSIVMIVIITIAFIAIAFYNMYV